MHTATFPAEVSRHKCLIYEGHPSEQLAVVVPFLAAGLKDNWRCLCLGDPVSMHMVDAALRRYGVDSVAEMKRGALVFSSQRSHLVNGMFDAEEMIQGLCELIDGAVQEGFQGLCATGDMRWELGPDQNFELLLEYEARLEQVFREKPLQGLCQYHRDFIPVRTLKDALLTHQSTYIGTTLNRDNLFYVPPEVLLETQDGEQSLKQGEWMCEQILRVINAESARDKALSKLAEMNRNLERRIRERTMEFEVANQQLEAFSYSVSHDLRAPLRSIMAFSDMLAADAGVHLSDVGRTCLECVRSNADRMEKLIAGLLAMSRLVTADMNRKTIDLTALAKDVEQEIRASEPERTVQFLIHENMRVIADEVLLRCVLTNLLGNAWKFTAKRSQARIEVGKTESEAAPPVFFIRDNGAGFEMRYADRLFSLFQRLHTQDEFPGTGIGLATVQRILAKHGGKIWAESRPDQGATFFFTLANEHSRFIM